jgi:4-amino-4-deoxy-L-arabinose transferase-like glycosyltransferase
LGSLPEALPSLSKRLTESRILLFYVGIIDFALHMSMAGNYGYFRDELYYIVSGQHLQAGYVDFPPMIAYIAALLNALAGDSLVAIHVVPALAGAALVVVAGFVARELGGNKWAQVLAAVAALVTAQLAFASIFSMDILDALWWSLCAYIFIRLLGRNEPRLWLAFGLVAGLGLFTKLTIAFFLLSLLVGILVTPARRYLYSRWFVLGAAVAIAFLVPYVLWNAANGWATVDFYIHHGGLNGTGPVDFIALQILIANPVNIPIVIAGLYFLLRSSSGGSYRAIGVALVFLFVLFVVINAKPYFYEAAYPILLAGGAVALTQKTGQVRKWVLKGLLVALVVSGALIAPLEMPFLPPTIYAGTYSALTGVANGAAAQGNAGQFPQYLGDRFGWNTMTQTVSEVYHSLPAQEQSEACVFASNYGEASAVAFLGKSDNLPPVISTHNNFYIWGPGNCGKVLITVGVNMTRLEQAYANVTQVGTIVCSYCMTNEDNVPVYLATNPTISLASVWSSLKDFS